MNEALHSSRFLVAALADGHVALDLFTGELYRVNANGAAICEGLSRGEPMNEILEGIAARFGVGRAIVARDGEEFAAVLLTECVAARGSEALSFTKTTEGFAVLHEGRPVLRVTGRGARGTWQETSVHRRQILEWALPHLLGLHGIPVLHASAVERAGRVMGFVGASGAGKTTLARVLCDASSNASHNLRLVSEDKLVLDGTSARIGCDAVMSEWLDASTSSMVALGNLVSAIVELPRLPLDAIALLDAAERHGERIVVTRIGACDAVAALLANAFAELEDMHLWSTAFSSTCALVNAGLVRRLTVPDGHGRLAAAARDYTSSSMS